MFYDSKRMRNEKPYKARERDGGALEEDSNGHEEVKNLGQAFHFSRSGWADQLRRLSSCTCETKLLSRIGTRSLKR